MAPRPRLTRNCAKCGARYLTTVRVRRNECGRCSEKRIAEDRKRRWHAKASAASHLKEIEEKRKARAERKEVELLEHNRSMVVCLLKGGYFR